MKEKPAIEAWRLSGDSNMGCIDYLGAEAASFDHTGTSQAVLAQTDNIRSAQHSVCLDPLLNYAKSGCK